MSKKLQWGGDKLEENETPLLDASPAKYGVVKPMLTKDYIIESQ